MGECGVGTDSSKSFVPRTKGLNRIDGQVGRMSGAGEESELYYYSRKDLYEA